MVDDDEDYLGQDDEDKNYAQSESLARRPMPQPTQPSITGASMAPPQVQPSSITSAPKQPLDMPRTGGPLDMSVAPTRPTPAADRLSTLEATPSGVSQKHGIAGGLLKGLDVAGSLLLPELTANIPGTTLNRQRGINEAGREAQGESVLDKNREQGVLDTSTISKNAAEAAADTENADTNRRKLDADANGTKIGMTPEETTIHDLMTGENGQPRINPQTDKPYQYLEAYQQMKQAGEKPDAAKTPSFQEQTYDEWAKAQSAAGKPADRVTFDKEMKQHEAAPERPQRQLMVVPNDPNDPSKGSRTIEVGPGMELPNGARTIQQEGSQNTKTDQTDDLQALKFASDYASMGTYTDAKGEPIYTGPGDEALMEKYFQLAKPKTGFRMSQPQIDMLQNARSWMDSIRGKLYHATHGVWFPEQQREDIVATMKQLATAKGVATDSTGGGGGTGANTSPSGGNQAPPDRPGFKTQSKMVDGKKVYRQVPIAQ